MNSFYIRFEKNGITDTIGLSTSCDYQEVAECIKAVKPEGLSFVMGYNGGKYHERKPIRYNTEYWRIAQVIKYIESHYGKANDAIIKLAQQCLQEISPKQEIVKPSIQHSNNRITGVFTKNNGIQFALYKGEGDNSHYALFNKLLEEYAIDWDNMECHYETAIGEEEYSGIFGAFYQLLCGNGTQIFIIYGSSSDYPTMKLTDERLDQYKKALRQLCLLKGWDFIWNI